MGSNSEISSLVMGIDQINSLLFAVHLLLLIVKLYVTGLFFSKFLLSKSTNGSKYMFVYSSFNATMFIFSFVVVLSELYFLANFYNDIDLYYYEYLAIFDQLLFTIICIKLIQRGENG